MIPRGWGALEARELVGVILAGGASSRMGQPKEAILLDGETLLLRQQRLLHEVGVRRVLLALGKAVRADHPGLLPEMTGEVVVDPSGSAGPLAGIVAGLRRINRPPPDPLSASGILVLAVDMPRLEAGLLRDLMEASSVGVGAAPQVDGRWEPLAAVYPREALEPAVRLLHGPGPASPSALLDELEASGLVRAHEVQAGWVTGLRSWNRPEDLPSGP